MAVGSAGIVLTSADDGQTWQSRTAASSNDWGGLAYDGVTIVAVAFSGAGTRVMLSTDDGHTWAAATTVPEANTWNAVCSPTVGTFVAVASSGTNRVMKSTDSGVTWSTKSASSAVSWIGVATDGSLLVAREGAGTFHTMVSSDVGESWTTYGTFGPCTPAGTSNTGSQPIGYSPTLGKFVISGRQIFSATHVYVSADGQLWTDLTPITTHVGFSGFAIADSFGGFFGATPFNTAFGNTTNIVFWSDDEGVTWTLDDTTFSSSTGNGWGPTSWDPATSTIVFFDPGADTVMVGTPPVTVTAISPDHGTTLGGTAVTITGTSFSGSPSVTIGGVACTSVVVVNATTITCVTGAHAAGLVDVVVGSATLSNAYTYIQPPVLTSLTPILGTKRGGTVVTLTGTGFTGTTSVTFGGTAAAGLVVTSDTSMTCVTAAHAGGLVDVSVVGIVATSTLTNAYTYVAVDRVSPKSGTVQGGTSVTITGFGFNAQAGVKFDGTFATHVVPDSITPNLKLTAVTPAHAAGIVDIDVQGVDTGAHLYTYTLPVPQLQGKGTLLPPIPTRRTGA